MSQNREYAVAAESQAVVELVVAVADNGVIGRDNALPWHLPEDLQHFKALTLGHAIVMGRLTFESIGRPLPGRRNLVLTRNTDWSHEGVEAVRSLAEARVLAAERPGNSLMVIGGAKIYADALESAETIHLTQIHAEFAGDTGFPKLNMRQWLEVSRESFPANGDRDFAYSFVKLVRKR